MSEILNPYRPGEPVADIAMLFGRQDAADWIEMQLKGKARVLILNALPLVGKTSFIKQVGGLHNLEAINLALALSAPTLQEKIRQVEPATDQAEEGAANAALQALIDQLLPQLAHYNLIPAQMEFEPKKPALVLRELFKTVNERLGAEWLVLYLDDLHWLLTDKLGLMTNFLTGLMPALDVCPQLHLVFTVNQVEFKRIRHPLLDGAPSFHLTTLTADASVNMVTLPVRNILRFDYGITRRIAETNSHHPYYLTIFCHTLLNRQMHDGWVNQRDFDATLAQILDSPIEPFTHMWDQSNWAERAVLSGMAAMQGRHGPITNQEVLRFLQKEEASVAPAVVEASLKSLAQRGVLVPMGAVSYRFCVELLRFWLREHTDPAKIVREVDWRRLAAQIGASQKSSPSSFTPPPRGTKEEEQPSSRKRPPWLMTALPLAAALCLLATGAILAAQFFGMPVAFLAQGTPPPSNTPVPTVVAGPATPTFPVPTLTPSPTPPHVVARTLPSLAYMSREINKSWRIFVMDADGSHVTPLSPEEAEDTVPVWSPDGAKIAFISQRDGNREIYVMDADGQNAVNVTRHPAEDWTPAWSPDGTQIGFSSVRSGKWEIYVMDAACLDQPESCPDALIQLTDDGHNNISPVWSPDGTRIAFTSKAGGNWDIYTMNPTGGDLKRVTADPGNDLAPVWSPNGQLFAFESNRSGKSVDIYIVDVNGTTTAQNITNLSLANDHGPTWSPDGQQLVFYSNREGNWDIFSTTLSGETVVNLTQTPNIDEQTPAWRP